MKTKTCSACGKDKPLNAKNWRRNRHSPDGFYRQCKPCSADAVKKHYRSWKPKDVKERGETGVQCILYSSEICQVCPCPSITELEKCVRLTETSPEYDDYPDILPQ